jgi:hypothetical protein
MKKYILFLSFIALVFFVSACTNNNPVKENQQTLKYAEKTSESTVTIDLIPHQYEKGILDIDISLNTHSVDMSQFDLKKQVRLILDDNEYYPVTVPSLRGHHNSGTLRFEIPKEPKEFKIIIKGIPDIKERVFEWP